MVPLTRRRLLHGATGIALALSGCNELTEGTAESTQTHPADETVESGPGSGSTADPASVAVRSADTRPPVWLGDSGDRSTRPTPTGRRGPYGGTLIDSDERAERIQVADEQAASRAESFLQETDFDGETVYLDSNRIGACFTLDLCRIAWQPDHVETDYGRIVRPYDERCDADRRVYEVRLIRIPDAIDRGNVNSHSSSIGAGACDRDSPRPEASGGSGEGQSSRRSRSQGRRAARTEPIGGGDR